MPVIPIIPSDNARAVEFKIALGRAYTERSAEYDSLARYRSYYAGDHDLLLSPDQLAFLAGVIGNDNDSWPIDNKCRKVVDKVRARINVTGWRDGAGGEAEVGDEVSDTGALGVALSWWTDNDMDRWEGEVYRAALRDGEAYLLVDHNGVRPRFTFAQRFDGLSGVRVVYEDEAKTRELYAVKYWSDLDPQTADVQADASTQAEPRQGVNGFFGSLFSNPWRTADPFRSTAGVVGISRATIYTPSQVYKYARFSGPSQRALYASAGPDTSDGWTPILDNGDTVWPLPWVDRQGKPLGLAVVPFVSPRGSLIAQVIGLNNALNKTNLDLLSIADQQGFGNLIAEYTKALPPPTVDKDDDGYGMRPGRIVEIAEGTIKKLPADDMAGLLNFARHLTISIASNADVPLHDLVPIGGEVPSGVALQMLDSALALQASEITVWFGGAWRRVMDLAQALAAQYGGLQGQPQTLTPLWAPTSYLDEQGMEANKSLVATRVKAYVEAGMPLEVALKHEGWSDEDITELTDAKEADAAAAQTSLASALASQQRAFDAGGVANTAGTPMIAGLNGKTTGMMSKAGG